MSQQSKFDEDPHWHQYGSRKLEQIAKWQKKCEVKYGFDPIAYFGKALNSEDKQVEL